MKSLKSLRRRIIGLATAGTGAAKSVIAICAAAAAIATGAPAFAEIINVDSQRLKELLAQNVTIVDVRRADEWEDTGIVDNSHMMTFFDRFGRYDANKWLSELSAISSPEDPVILICHSGVRSKVVGNWLSKGIGYRTVYNVESGIVEWMEKGNETVKP